MLIPISNFSSSALVTQVGSYPASIAFCLASSLPSSLGESRASIYITVPSFNCTLNTSIVVVQDHPLSSASSNALRACSCSSVVAFISIYCSPSAPATVPCMPATNHTRASFIVCIDDINPVRAALNLSPESPLVWSYKGSFFRLLASSFDTNWNVLPVLIGTESSGISTPIAVP